MTYLTPIVSTALHSTSSVEQKKKKRPTLFYVRLLILELVEMIQLEAVRRLRHGSGFDDDEINSLGILPSLRDSNRSGLIWYSSQRYEHHLHFL